MPELISSKYNFMLKQTPEIKGTLSRVDSLLPFWEIPNLDWEAISQRNISYSRH